VTSPPGSFAYPPAPAPPARKRRTWLVVLVSVAVVTLLVCGFGLVRLFLNLKHVTDIDKEVNQATAAFIEDTRDGLSQGGYDGLCAEAKEQFRPQDLAAPHPVTGFRITGTDVEYARGQATVRVEIQRADGSTTEEAYILAEEAERWKMCAFPG
jgi:hypothetical protein